jgi:alpha-galactosidase
MHAAPAVLHLRRGGTSVALRLDRDVLPCVLHWGPDLGAASVDDLDALVLAARLPVSDSVLHRQEAVSLLPQHSTGWLGRPGLLGSRDGAAWSVAFDAVTHRVDEAGDETWPDGPAGGVRLVSTGTDPACGLEVTTELRVLTSGLVALRATVTNRGEDRYEVQHLEPALPVPDEAQELLDMTGRHSHERVPQRHPFETGQWVREAWGGRPGHDAATVLCAGTPGFGFRRGTVWGVHLAWSGNQVLSAERHTAGWRLLRGGEKLLPGEGRLEPDASYRSPWLYGSWGRGLDEYSGRFHEHLRARPQHPRSPRPVVLNTWEAVYFDHDLPKLLALAEAAADLGVERFVLDDGWFRARRDDTAGLGDWYVDETVWPDGLTPLVERVRALGMDFGLWVEPEMVNLDSDLARAHPDWVLQSEHGPGLPSRQQHVLDVGHPEAYAYVVDRISSLVKEYAVSYLKWDHNRPLVDAGQAASGRPGVHAQTLAAYRMMEELKRLHPGLEIESCCAGGGRLDLGVMEHADRAWVSDCIDAHERHRMVRWTGLTLPPELMGTHVGSGRDHTTGRRLSLDFRAGTALFGHFGVEWDVTTADPEELDRLRTWIGRYKQHRSLLHSGTVVNADLGTAGLELTGVVARDRGEALYRLSALAHAVVSPPGRVPLPGLDPDRVYLVTATATPSVPIQGLAAATERLSRMPWARDGLRMTGRLLERVGVQAPALPVDELVLIHVTACDREEASADDDHVE